jgi:hypothetical protein
MIPLGNCEENSNASTAEFAWSLPQGKEQTTEKSRRKANYPSICSLFSSLLEDNL